MDLLLSWWIPLCLAVLEDAASAMAPNYAVVADHRFLEGRIIQEVDRKQTKQYFNPTSRYFIFSLKHGY
jgi:hypothetical protein